MSEEFQGKATLARHRLVNERLKEEIAELHAFSQVRLVSSILVLWSNGTEVLMVFGLEQKTYTPKQYEALAQKAGQ